VYGFSAGCVCAVLDDRSTGEDIDLDVKAGAERDAVRVALRALQGAETISM
jgi:uridine phosphorylase